MRRFLPLLVSLISLMGRIFSAEYSAVSIVFAAEARTASLAIDACPYHNVRRDSRLQTVRSLERFERIRKTYQAASSRLTLRPVFRYLEIEALIHPSEI